MFQFLPNLCILYQIANRSEKEESFVDLSLGLEFRKQLAEEGVALDKDVSESTRASPLPSLATCSSIEALDDLNVPAEVKPTLDQTVQPGSAGEVDDECSKTTMTSLKPKLSGKSKKESCMKANSLHPVKSVVSGSKSKKKPALARRSTVPMSIEDCLHNFTMEEHLSEPIVS